MLTYLASNPREAIMVLAVLDLTLIAIALR